MSGSVEVRGCPVVSGCVQIRGRRVVSGRVQVGCVRLRRGSGGSRVEGRGRPVVSGRVRFGCVQIRGRPVVSGCVEGRGSKRKPGSLRLPGGWGSRGEVLRLLALRLRKVPASPLHKQSCAKVAGRCRSALCEHNQS